jgi:hypothetical protein
MMTATQIVATGNRLRRVALPLCEYDLNAASLLAHEELLRLLNDHGGGKAPVLRCERGLVKGLSHDRGS